MTIMKRFNGYFGVKVDLCLKESTDKSLYFIKESYFAFTAVSIIPTIDGSSKVEVS